ncbi:hypothetical protein Fmac_009592 [Flemingia macrophylla]|uniref:3'-5' exonuclease domain-containing protein n=1 Tax=Flemingia macrophylla TaxID=520843 RepID=A0ABD1N0N9_9FABA
MATVVERYQRSNHEVCTVNLAGTHIAVTVTRSAAVAKRWISSTLHFSRQYVYHNALIAGLGVQWNPNRRDPPPPHTLQLCVGRRCLIFQLAHAGDVPDSLRAFLNNPSHTFVGFWNNSDRQRLQDSQHHLLMRRDPVDLRLCFQGLNQASVEEIVAACLGYRVSQRNDISRSEWNDLDLSDDQVAYATVDAHCAFLIGRNLSAWRYNR